MAKLVGQTSTNARIIKFSGVNPNIFWGGIEAPKAPRIFLILDLKMAICGAFLVQFFCSSAKTLTVRKNTLAQVYFYWGGGAIAPLAPPGIGATDQV